jgi:HSP20 family protein
MAMVRWEPVRDLLTLQERMNRMLDSSYRGNNEEDWALGGSWAPAVDIYEKDGNIVLKAELPGVDPKAVDVRVENNLLTLRGERKFDDEVKRDNYHRVERSYGAFSRSFTLPNVVDTGNIKAEYRDGVLHMTLPKREEAKPRQIQINVGR